MPVRTIENSQPIIRPWVRSLIVAVRARVDARVPVGLGCHRLLGLEWPTAGRDTAAFTMIWAALVVMLVATAQ